MMLMLLFLFSSRRLHQNKHYTRADFTLDPIADQSLHEETTAITG